VFPSQTDTFGLVVLEAMASGVPVVLRPDAAARLGLQDGDAACVTEDPTESVLRLMRDPGLRRKMGLAAREFACSKAWFDVFEQLYLTYEEGVKVVDLRRAPPKLKRSASAVRTERA
jgi:glycosyltransferase involved in cell wall biosynthesis